MTNTPILPSNMRRLEILADNRGISIDTLLTEMFATYEHTIHPELELSSNEYVDTFIDATRILGDTLDLPEIMNLLLGYVARIVTFDRAYALYIEDSLARIVTSSVGSESITADQVVMDTQWDVMTHPLFKRLFVNQQALLNEDLPTLRDLFSTGDQIQSYLGLPILSNHSVVGFVFVTNKVADFYQEIHIEWLTPFVRLIGYAIQNVKLYLTVSQNADELAALYHATSVLFQADNLRDFAEQITEVVVRAFDYADCGLMIVDRDLQEVIRVSRAGSEGFSPQNRLLLAGKGLVPKSIRQGILIYEPDVQNSADYVTGDNRSRCELVVPLKTSKGIIGVLDFQSTALDAFSSRDQRIIVAFAERVAPALENVLLYDRLREYNKELEVHVQERAVELHHTKEQLEAIIENSPDPIVLLNENGLIQQTNPALFRMLDQLEDDVVGKSIDTFLLADDAQRFRDKFASMMQEHVPCNIEVVLAKPKGIRRNIEISLAPIRHGTGIGVVGNVRDVTQRRQTEELLRDALKNAKDLSDLKSNFVTMASHEFRTPLTTILSSSDIVKNYFERLTSEKLLQHMAKIQREVDHLNGLIDDILLIGSTGDEGFVAKYEIVELPTLIMEVIERIRNLDQDQHVIRVENSCNQTVTDKKLLGHILDNLVSNACKYSASGSDVVVTITCDDDLSLTVKDHGIGIPQTDIDAIFDSFYRGRNVGNVRGTGIGLAIVREALQALSGTAEIESELGKGTSFTVHLPFEPLPKSVL